MTIVRGSAVLLMVLALFACDAGDPTGPGTMTPVASVALSPDTATLEVGQSLVLNARAFGSSGSELSGRPVAWSSSDTMVITVDAAGRAQAREVGTAIVSAKVETKVARSVLRVRAPAVPVAIVEIEPSEGVTLIPGGSRQLTAKTYAANGTELVGRTVTWSSNATTVSTVDASGKVTAVKEGTAVITAASEGRTAQVQILVELPAQTPAVASIEVRPAVVVTYVGVEAPLRTVLRAADGSLITGRSITWTTSNDAVATVSSEGVIMGRAGGDAVITATVEGRTATVSVTLNTTSTYHLAFDREEPAFYWMDMRTGQADRMLEHAGEIRSTDPSPSPTRSGFAYVHTYGGSTTPQIAIQSWSGTTYQFLTAGDEPAWSPDGSRILFRSTRGGRADVWSIAADGSAEPVNLTADLPQGVESGRPAWSPSGDRIVFAASNPRGGSDLWIMRGDGSGKRPLTSGPFIDTEPTWFGDRIVFTRRTDEGTSDLYWMHVSGATTFPLTSMGSAQMPAWSPDGRWIAFVVRDGTAGIGDVYVMRADGSDVRPVTLGSDGPAGGGLNPAWTLHW